MSNGPCKTPLVDLLRDVPRDARQMFELSPTSHQNIPYGRLCHEAADEIERLQSALREIEHVVYKQLGPVPETTKIKVTSGTAADIHRNLEITDEEVREAKERLTEKDTK